MLFEYYILRGRPQNGLPILLDPLFTELRHTKESRAWSRREYLHPPSTSPCPIAKTTANLTTPLQGGMHILNAWLHINYN